MISPQILMDILQTSVYLLLRRGNLHSGAYILGTIYLLQQQFLRSYPHLSQV